jgi:hypothetical protein
MLILARIDRTNYRIVVGALLTAVEALLTMILIKGALLTLVVGLEGVLLTIDR